MTLLRMSAQSFRNLESSTLEFCDGINIFYGDNAQGKTNLLESIFLLGTLKSFRMARNSDLINWGKDFSLLRGWVNEDSSLRELALLLDNGSKKIRVDSKSVTHLADFFGILTVVLFAPEELMMVRGVPETRRRYLDRAIFAGDIMYLSRHHDFSRILRQRNSLLKSGDLSSLDIWSEQLVSTGAQMVNQRVEYLARLDVLLQKAYAKITGTGDSAGIAYRAAHGDYTADAGENACQLRLALAKLKDREIQQRTTLVGPHRDDILFQLNGKPLRHAASQGQQRCFMLALKMAEIDYLRQHEGQSPVLLLDDMTSELDQQRTENLLHFLTERGMQVFVTTTGMEQVKGFLNHERLRTFHVKQGRATRDI